MSAGRVAGRVGAFLRGEGAAPPWRLDLRPSEGGAWRAVQAAGGPAALRDEVLAPSFDWSAGDLVRLVGPGDVTRGVWVGTARGLLDAGRVPIDLGDDLGAVDDWVTAWEGPQAEADALLRCTDPVEPWRVVLAGCDCVAAALPLLPPRREGPARAVAAARAWALGVAAGADPAVGAEAVAQAAQRAMSRASTVARTPAQQVPYYVASAAREAARAVDGETATNAANAAVSAASALCQSGRERPFGSKRAGDAAIAKALRALAPLVRRAIPLPVLLLARAGELPPPELAAPPADA